MDNFTPVNKGDVFDDCKVIGETDMCYIVGRTRNERTYFDIIMLKDEVGEYNSKEVFKARVDHILIAHDGVPGVVVKPCTD